MPGLAEAVRVEALNTVGELLPLWLAEPPIDLRRAVRPSGPQSFTINVEQHRGVRTWLSFQRKLAGFDCIRILEEAVRRHQPELLGYASVPGMVHKIDDLASAATHWCRTVADEINEDTTQEIALERLMAQLDAAIATNLITHEAKSPLTGLALPQGIPEIWLARNVSVREMSDDEVSEIASGDVMNPGWHDITSNPVRVALVATEQVPFILTRDNPGQTLENSFQRDVQDRLSAVRSALHVLKQGRLGIAGTYFRFAPPVLPFLAGRSSSHAFFQPPFASMELSQPEVQEFLDIHAGLQRTIKDEVKIAAGRLVDAANRLSPVDALT